ncbi:hypothetical protein [Tsukamurella paurometabola]|uniref:TIGR04222 domain-containing membrane protein n=1 Tax=Tsukamurella paurometabola TaxID=2061 RepID=A0ABS5NAQ3_TSUPA|nr:hypothetical protein [Tsukamurella paurometabola]MBS4101110.1 hypothetical protein [Tsukamurella paurometabola]
MTMHYAATGETWGMPSRDFLAMYLILCVLSVTAALVVRNRTGGPAPRVRVPRRLTPAGRRELEAARQRNAYLHPRLDPSMRTYGPTAAAYGAALFGVGSLMLFDPVLAAAPASAQAAAMTPGYAIGGGTGGSGGSSCSSSFSSCSSSSCGSSSSSSSCGGGGCGG